MRYSITTAQVIILAGVASAIPHPQLGGGLSDLIPTGGLGGGLGDLIPTGGLGGGLSDLIPTGGLGGGLSDIIPTGLPSLGSGGSGLSDLIGGGLGGSDDSITTTKTKASSAATATPTGEASNSTSNTARAASSVASEVATPSSTSSAGTIGKDCKPQSGGGMSENGIKDKNCCTDLTVIFARGTGEPGNAGIISGPPMFKALRQKLGADRVTVQGVNYPASVGGNAASGGNGGKTMAELVSTALSQCPDTKIILSGYSQGGMVVHSAFKAGVTKDQVAGAVQFGDPYKRLPIGDLPKDKVKQFCGTADQVCGGGGDGGAKGSHLSYGSVADAAATFAIEAAGLN